MLAFRQITEVMAWSASEGTAICQHGEKECSSGKQDVDVSFKKTKLVTDHRNSQDQNPRRDMHTPAYAGDDPKPSCTTGRHEEGCGTQLPEEGEPPCSLAAARGWKRNENQTIPPNSMSPH